MRSCLSQSKLTFEYSLERVIDDWVLMGFLVGNDFIPHLPHIHIHQDCLPLLWQTYKTVLPTLDGRWQITDLSSVFAADFSDLNKKNYVPCFGPHSTAVAIL